MKKRTAAIMSIALLCSSAYAGFNGLTAHSRGNCLTINESIMWDATQDWTTHIFDTHSHTIVRQYHDDDSKIQTTWRNAIVHVGESTDDRWLVSANFWLYHNNKWEKYDSLHMIGDCSMYDGWWHKDHPERDSKGQRA